MKLIGAGLPRTGTLSQKVGLEVVGQGPCYHMVNILAGLDLVPQWRRALDGNGQWDEIFDGFEATVDWPGSFFYRELMEVYPDAKVLLSTRDSESWARSMRETIWGVIYGENVIRYLSDARCEIDPKWDSYIELMKEMWQRSGLMEAERGSGNNRIHDVASLLRERATARHKSLTRADSQVAAQPDEGPTDVSRQSADRWRTRRAG